MWRDLILFTAWFLFHLFCSGWIADWVYARSGISDAEYKAYIDEYEARASKGKRKLEIWCSDTLPGDRERHKWCRAHAADPAIYNRCLWISRLAELPATVFSLRCLFAFTEFWGHGPVSGWFYVAIIVYDLILLLLGILWRRSNC